MNVGGSAEVQAPGSWFDAVQTVCRVTEDCVGSELVFLTFAVPRGLICFTYDETHDLSALFLSAVSPPTAGFCFHASPGTVKSYTN